jgi:Copper type II ascorbate-dependent monooxygenase, N-terminal domain/Copper type II ascorbate-dependent monooxygenase, C-terminal domain
MRRRHFVLLLAALAVGAVLAALGASGGSGASPGFERDVAPILQAKCEGCHRIGGIAPFAFATRQDVKEWAPVMASAIRSRLMPPWPPGPRSPAYVGEGTRKLSPSERATILDWVRSGAKVDGPPRKPLPAPPIPVAAGESVLRVGMPTTYRPTSRNGATDDYRCFLLDPKLAQDVFVTSARIVPGANRVVHHVILFKETPPQVAEAKRLDAASPGQGWSCFGGTGVSIASSAASVESALNDANWIAAWAPGWGGGRLPDGNGVPLQAGSQIVMQVHYNLLNGKTPDRSQAVLTVAPASAHLTPVETMLVPAPVELACTGKEHGPLCTRNAALQNLVTKYGGGAGIAPAGLLLLCGQDAAHPRPSAVSTCDRRFSAPTKILVVAGHMHLLGASIRLTLNPGTPRARVLLDIPRWNFHWQNAYTLAQPVEAKPGDVVRVTCRYDVGKRVHLGNRVARAPRYVLWGEGTTDEMCLGLLQVTRG